VEGNLFFSAKVYSHNYLLFYATSLSAIFSVFIISMKMKNLLPINWLGKHSLIILCVHFPFIQRLNVLISQTSLYTDMGIGGRVLAGLIVYAIIIAICIPSIFLCKRCIPILTGYKSYFSDKK
jgi:fucose 4-O-acetylase-like acetyltransferase